MAETVESVDTAGCLATAEAGIADLAETAGSVETEVSADTDFDSDPGLDLILDCYFGWRHYYWCSVQNFPVAH